LISHLPLSGDTTDIALEIEGYIPPVPGMTAYEQSRIISTDYFRTMTIPLLQGREFLTSDSAERPNAVIVSESFAKKYFPAGNPIGKRIRRGGVGSRNDWSMVVGVVGDIRHFGLAKEIRPQIYFPYTQVPERSVTIVARIFGTPRAMTDLIQRQVHAIDKDLAVYEIQSMEQTVRESIAQPRFNLYLTASFSLLAVVLACIGIYGVISYTVSRQTKEFGIRIALGARSKDILSIVMKEGLLLVCAGLVIGSFAAIALGRTLSSLVFRVNPNDPASHILVAGMLAAIALAACVAPAVRAIRIDPARTLRAE
jgi:putative ABC transport system permease protein